MPFPTPTLVLYPRLGTDNVEVLKELFKIYHRMNNLNNDKDKIILSAF